MRVNDPAIHLNLSIQEGLRAQDGREQENSR
jgi:hypothetical protein